MLLMPSGPSRLTACFTRSVRPQLSIRKPRSCRNFASVEVASSLLEAQTQSSVLKGKAQDSRCRQGGFGLLAKPHVFPDHLTCFHSHQRKKENHFSYLLLIFLACVLVHTSARRYFLFPDEVVGSPNTNAHTHTHTHTLCSLKATHCLQPYRSWRGSQSTPGSSSLAACRTSSLSTEKLRLCSV